jgi:nicotinamide riboside kinase
MEQQFNKRIAFTGPESSGKSTLSELVAQHFSADLQLEFAREFLEKSDGKYIQEDLDVIAFEQEKRWNLAHSKVLQVCDTEFLVLKIWSEYKFGKVSQFIQNGFKNQHFEHYFLCYPDIPWEIDPFRENEHERIELFELYQAALTQENYPFTLVKGTINERLKQCIQIIEQL